jgi:DNA uptake protein ComE-like DNA-binding protein
MRIGDLSRARAAVEPRGRASFLALSLTLATSVLLVGWLALPSSNQPAAETNIAAASGQDLTTSRVQPDDTPRPAPAPSPAAPPLRVADAGSDVSYAGAPASGMPAKTDAASIGVQSASIGNPITPQAEVIEAPAPAQEQAEASSTAPEVEEPTEVASVTGATTGTNPRTDTQKAVGLVDLNTASVDALNTLRGGGRIGRSIVRGRPYASVEDLVKKRILSRSVYARVKDQVTAR